jgi:hypothetical protein
MMGHPAFLGYQARWVPEVFLVPGDLVVCQDHLEFLEPKAAKEQREMRAHLVHRGRLVKLEAKVPWDHPVQLVHLVRQDKPVREENLAYPVYQDQMELLEIQEILDNLEPKVIPVPLAMLALLVFLDPEVLKETTGREVQMENQVKRVNEAMRVLRETWAKKETVDCLDRWDKPENLAHRVQKAVKVLGEKRALLVLLVIKAKLDLQDFQATLEDLETKEIKASKEAMECLVQKANEAGMVQ